MPPDLQLLHPERAAHATIRGFLYQTCLGVLRWLDLAPEEVLVCEGDEDLDRLIRGGEGLSEQSGRQPIWSVWRCCRAAGTRSLAAIEEAVELYRELAASRRQADPAVS